jgi:hypothetical protein
MQDQRKKTNRVDSLFSIFFCFPEVVSPRVCPGTSTERQFSLFLWLASSVAPTVRKY